MSELKSSARLRMMAKGACSRGDVIAADRLARIAIELDNKDEEIEILAGDLNALKLASHRYIKRNTKRKKDYETKLAAAKAEIAEYRSALSDIKWLTSNKEGVANLHNAIDRLLAKHKESK